MEIAFYLHDINIILFIVYHSSLVTEVTSNDRSKSVHNCCAIEHFGGVFSLSLCFLNFQLAKTFCHRTWSDLFLFASVLSVEVLLSHRHVIVFICNILTFFMYCEVDICQIGLLTSVNQILNI